MEKSTVSIAQVKDKKKTSRWASQLNQAQVFDKDI